MNNLRQGQPYVKDCAAVNEIRQKFEDWSIPRNRNVYRRGGFYVDIHAELDWKIWRAAYEAGEIAMKEKAAELRESLKLICAEAESWHTMHDHDGNGLVQCDSICALIPRMKAALSGAEESTSRKK